MNFDVESARRQMIDQQVRAWDVLDDRVLETLAAVPREHFVPEAYREVAPQPEGYSVKDEKDLVLAGFLAFADASR